MRVPGGALKSYREDKNMKRFLIIAIMAGALLTPETIQDSRINARGHAINATITNRAHGLRSRVKTYGAPVEYWCLYDIDDIDSDGGPVNGGNVFEYVADMFEAYQEIPTGTIYKIDD